MLQRREVVASSASSKRKCCGDAGCSIDKGLKITASYDGVGVA